MDQEPGSSRTAVTQTQEPEQIEREIEQTREELGDTVEALAKKTDVKAQAQGKVEDTKATISEKKDQLLGQAKQAGPDDAVAAASQAADKARAKPVPTAAVGAFAAGFLFGRLTKR